MSRLFEIVKNNSECKNFRKKGEHPGYIALFKKLPRSIRDDLKADRSTDYEKVNAAALLSVQYVLGYDNKKFTEHLDALKARGHIPEREYDIWRAIMDFWYERNTFDKLADNVKIAIRRLVCCDDKYLHSKAQLSAVYAFHTGRKDCCVEDLKKSLLNVVEAFSAPDTFNKNGTLNGKNSHYLYCKLEKFSGELLKYKENKDSIWDVDLLGHLVFKKLNKRKDAKTRHMICKYNHKCKHSSVLADR